jgi:hypothetical protein
MTGKRPTLIKIVAAAVGIIGFILFMWTPKTREGILAYALLLAILIVTAIIMSYRNRTGFWPDDPRKH